MIPLPPFMLGEEIWTIIPEVLDEYSIFIHRMWIYQKQGELMGTNQKARVN